ncbi:hypothetical protein ABK040_016411 [Willaertia magna]
MSSTTSTSLFLKGFFKYCYYEPFGELLIGAALFLFPQSSFLLKAFIPSTFYPIVTNLPNSIVTATPVGTNTPLGTTTTGTTGTDLLTTFSSNYLNEIYFLMRFAGVLLMGLGGMHHLGMRLLYKHFVKEESQLQRLRTFNWAIIGLTLGDLLHVLSVFLYTKSYVDAFAFPAYISAGNLLMRLFYIVKYAKWPVENVGMHPAELKAQ